jgi:hypothetical protein
MYTFISIHIEMKFFGNEVLSKDMGTFQKPFLKFEITK